MKRSPLGRAAAESYSKPRPAVPPQQPIFAHVESTDAVNLDSFGMPLTARTSTTVVEVPKVPEDVANPVDALDSALTRFDAALSDGAWAELQRCVGAGLAAIEATHKADIVAGVDEGMQRRHLLEDLVIAERLLSAGLRREATSGPVGGARLGSTDGGEAAVIAEAEAEISALAAAKTDTSGMSDEEAAAHATVIEKKMRAAERRYELATKRARLAAEQQCGLRDAARTTGRMINEVADSSARVAALRKQMRELELSEATESLRRAAEDLTPANEQYKTSVSDEARVSVEKCERALRAAKVALEKVRVNHAQYNLEEAESENDVRRSEKLRVALRLQQRSSSSDLLDLSGRQLRGAKERDAKLTSPGSADFVSECQRNLLIDAENAVQLAAIALSEADAGNSNFSESQQERLDECRTTLESFKAMLLRAEEESDASLAAWIAAARSDTAKEAENTAEKAARSAAADLAEADLADREASVSREALSAVEDELEMLHSKKNAVAGMSEKEIEGHMIMVDKQMKAASIRLRLAKSRQKKAAEQARALRSAASDADRTIQTAIEQQLTMSIDRERAEAAASVLVELAEATSAFKAADAEVVRIEAEHENLKLRQTSPDVSHDPLAAQLDATESAVKRKYKAAKLRVMLAGNRERRAARQQRELRMQSKVVGQIAMTEAAQEKAVAERCKAARVAAEVEAELASVSDKSDEPLKIAAVARTAAQELLLAKTRETCATALAEDAFKLWVGQPQDHPVVRRQIPRDTSAAIGGTNYVAECGGDTGVMASADAIAEAEGVATAARENTVLAVDALMAVEAMAVLPDADTATAGLVTEAMAAVTAALSAELKHEMELARCIAANDILVAAAAAATKRVVIEDEISALEKRAAEGARDLAGSIQSARTRLRLAETQESQAAKRAVSRRHQSSVDAAEKCVAAATAEEEDFTRQLIAIEANSSETAATTTTLVLKRKIATQKKSFAEKMLKAVLQSYAKSLGMDAHDSSTDGFARRDDGSELPGAARNTGKRTTIDKSGSQRRRGPGPVMDSPDRLIDVDENLHPPTSPETPRIPGVDGEISPLNTNPNGEAMWAWGGEDDERHDNNVTHDHDRFLSNLA